MCLISNKQRGQAALPDLREFLRDWLSISLKGSQTRTHCLQVKAAQGQEGWLAPACLTAAIYSQPALRFRHRFDQLFDDLIGINLLSLGLKIQQHTMAQDRRSNRAHIFARDVV